MSKLKQESHWKPILAATIQSVVVGILQMQRHAITSRLDDRRCSSQSRHRINASRRSWMKAEVMEVRSEEDGVGTSKSTGYRVLLVGD